MLARSLLHGLTRAQPTQMGLNTGIVNTAVLTWGYFRVLMHLS